ncbi:MAG TPA: DNA alkylation repair protein [Treponema sp.]|nr:DNA alkylation repair protein [Treponema sp.]
MTLDEVENELKSLVKKDNYREFSSSLNPTASPILGVRIPQLRTLAKKIAGDTWNKPGDKASWQIFLEQNPLTTFEHQALQAMVIGYARADINLILNYLKDFIPHIHDWAVNDILCQTFKTAQKHQETVWNFLMNYKDSRKEFEVRVVAIMLMTHFLNDAYIDRVLKVLNTLYTDTSRDSATYYAKMGIAWAVATAACKTKYPDLTYEFMKSPSNRLDSWTYNKAIRKMQESFRVTPEIKEKMNQLKK